MSGAVLVGECGKVCLEMVSEGRWERRCPCLVCARHVLDARSMHVDCADTVEERVALELMEGG